MRGDGALLSLTFEPDQRVRAWARHSVGGAVVESIAAIPNPDGTADELWLIARRTIGGTTRRYIEFIEAQDSGHHVDAGLLYDGAATGTVSGLDHLEGETVQVVANGTAHPDCVVASGSITLNGEYSLVHAGLFADAAVTTMKIEAGSANGTAQGKRKRIERIIARVYNSIGGKAGSPDGNLDGLLKRDSASPMSAAGRSFSASITRAGLSDAE